MKGGRNKKMTVDVGRNGSGWMNGRDTTFSFTLEQAAPLMLPRISFDQVLGDSSRATPHDRLRRWAAGIGVIPRQCW